MKLGKQLFGYNKKDVDYTIEKLQLQIEKMNLEIEGLNREKADLENQVRVLTHRVNINDKSNEDISRLALKEASELIEKAKKNASMILKESLDYVRTLNSEVEGYKEKAKAFRSDVEKISQELLKSIDESELYYLIDETEREIKEADSPAPLTQVEIENTLRGQPEKEEETDSVEVEDSSENQIEDEIVTQASNYIASHQDDNEDEDSEEDQENSQEEEIDKFALFEGNEF